MWCPILTLFFNEYMSFSSHLKNISWFFIRKPIDILLLSENYDEIGWDTNLAHIFAIFNDHKLTHDDYIISSSEEKGNVISIRFIVDRTFWVKVQLWNHD